MKLNFLRCGIFNATWRFFTNGYEPGKPVTLCSQQMIFELIPGRLLVAWEDGVRVEKVYTFCGRAAISSPHPIRVGL